MSRALCENRTTSSLPSHDVLGHKVNELPGNYEKGEMVIDTAMDLETNVSTEFAGDNSLLLKHGVLSRSATVKMAQTFRTGTNDIDALDFCADVPARMNRSTRRTCMISMIFTCW